MPPKTPASEREIPFWLTKIPASLKKEVEARRRLLGQNKKVTMSRALRAYLATTEKDIALESSNV